MKILQIVVVVVVAYFAIKLAIAVLGLLFGIALPVAVVAAIGYVAYKAGQRKALSGGRSSLL